MKIDHKKTIGAYSAKHGTFSEVVVPTLKYLMIDGEGDPNTSAYADAVGSLYPLAYGLKFLSKDQLGQDYVVMPLEALWWSEDMASFTSARDKSRWNWTAMIMVPDWITRDHLEQVRPSKSAPRIEDVRLETYDEGPAVQTLHIGSYDDEGPVLESMHRVISAKGLSMTGRHHEIYLTDPRRAQPSKLRTVLRQPVSS